VGLAIVGVVLVGVLVAVVATRGGIDTAGSSGATNPVAKVVGANLVDRAVGTWTCTQGSPPKSGAWETATVVIKADGTFSVDYGDRAFGGDGTWKLDGTTLKVNYRGSDEMITGVAPESSVIVVDSDGAEFAVAVAGDREVSFKQKPLNEDSVRRFDFTCKKQ
jgi:hypothetical protein